MSEEITLRDEIKRRLPTCRRGDGFADTIETDKEPGVFRGRAVPYNQWIALTPDIREIYEPGVFAKQMRDPARVKICLEHGQVVGRVLEFDEREDGLHFRARISPSGDIPEARKAQAMLDDDLADELSVGFMAMPNGTDETNENGVTKWRHKRARLLEISLVPWGAMGRHATVTRASFYDDGGLAEALALAERQAEARAWLEAFKARG